jgi:F-box-like
MDGNGGIPTEILLEILVQVLPPRLDEDGRREFLSLRSVCSRWRSLAFSSPIFWSSVSVNRRVHGARHDSKSIARWFLRAGPSMKLELEYVDPLQRLHDPEGLQSLILRYQHRWTFLALCIRRPYLWNILCSPPTDNWVNLHTITFWLYNLRPSDSLEASRLSQALDGMVLLQRLFIEDYTRYEYNTSIGPSGLAELHITIGDFGVHQARLISSYQHLTKLFLSARTMSPVISTAEHITLPSLLFMSCDNLSFLQHFTTPSLCEFEIKLITHFTAKAEDSIISGFLARCYVGLQSLTLDGTVARTYYVPRILPMLSAQPSLQRLSVPLWPLGMGSQTLYGFEEQRWCPNLRSLTVSMPDADSGRRMEVLADFLQARQEVGVKRIESLTVHKPLKGVRFPYEMFRNVQVDKIRVTVPL